MLGGPAEPEVPVDAFPGTVAIEDLYDDLYQRFVDLQRSATGFLSYADRRLARTRREFEEQLAFARDETLTVAGLNQAMADELRALSDRLRELGVTDLPALSWLADADQGTTERFTT